MTSFDRRSFVKAGTAAGALAWLAVRQPLSAQPVPGYLDPVPFVADPRLSGLTEAQLQDAFTVDPNPDPAQQAATYPQSVASGDPRPQGIVLWTRVATGVPGDIVFWQIASDSAFTTVVANGMYTLTNANDLTVKIAVLSNQLSPFTQYFYRFIYNNLPSRTGVCKTLPAATANLQQLNLGYVVCQDFGNGYYTALAHLAQENVDYVVHLGDYIYETINSSSFQNNPVRTVPPFASGGAIPQNVDDYRHLYKVYRGDLNQQAVHEKFTYIQLWDDHEFANDCHQDFHPDNNPTGVTATTPQPALRQAANQAWAEYSLADVPFNPATNPDGTPNWQSSIQLYRTFSFGTLAEMIVTDERLYRDPPPCGSNEAGQRYFSLGCGAMGDSSRYMLGATQHSWFVNQLQSSKATWKLWANEVMLMQLKLGPIYIDLDQWDGYQQERNSILNVIKHGNIKNVVALTGDLHTFLAGYLKTDFDNPFEPNIGVELMVGSITSANFAEEIESALPLSSRPLPAKSMGVPPNLLDPVIRAANPWIQYWDSSTHGYGVLTITPSHLVCQYKAVTTITQPTANLVPLKTFTVPVNQVKLIQS
jgi:alkaline phosphatase D